MLLSSKGSFYEVDMGSETQTVESPNEETTDQQPTNADLQLIYDKLVSIDTGITRQNMVFDFVLVFVGCAVLFYIFVVKPMRNAFV